MPVEWALGSGLVLNFWSAGGQGLMPKPGAAVGQELPVAAGKSGRSTFAMSGGARAQPL